MATYIAEASAPTRSNGTITLTCGLLNIEVSTYKATEELNVSRKEFVDGDVAHPAGRAIIDKSTGEIVENVRIKRMAETSSGEWVELTDDEIAEATGQKNVATVIGFLPRAEARQYVPTGDVMQLRPKKVKGVANPAHSKALGLILHTMNSLEVVALVKVATRGLPRYGLVSHDGLLSYVYHTDEVRQPLDLPSESLAQAEVDMAVLLVQSMMSNYEPLHNETAKQLQAIVDAKATGQVVSPAPSTPPAQVDIMAALTASIQAAKEQKATVSA